MLLNSIEFLVFFVVFFFAYWFVFKSKEWQNLLICIAGVFFLYTWNYMSILFILIAAWTSFLSALLIEKADYQPRKSTILSMFNILVNVGILFVFKYFNFFAESFAFFLNTIGLKVDWVTLNLVLPVGLSFYSFSAISYVLDVYKRKMYPSHNFIDYFAYLSFFPKLIAGPIERASDFLPQLEKKREFDESKAVDGMRQFLWGLIKKIVVADNCAIAVDEFFLNPQQTSSLNLIIGAMLFSIQIYADFSGYSDMALGVSKVLGLNLKLNFKFPYFARNMAEFWRRWHISLTSWFRDYVYIPLGGSHCSKALIIRNTFIVYLVSGLWHGANWTFVVWGGFHALLFLPLILTGSNKKYKDDVSDDRLLPSIKAMFYMLITFILATVGWVIFRADNLENAGMYFYSMISNTHIPQTLMGKEALLYTFLMLLVEWIQRRKDHGLEITLKGIFKYRIARWCLYIGLVFLVFIAGGEPENFIYAQF